MEVEKMRGLDVVQDGESEPFLPCFLVRILLPEKGQEPLAARLALAAVRFLDQLEIVEVNQISPGLHCGPNDVFEVGHISLLIETGVIAIILTGAVGVCVVSPIGRHLEPVPRARFLGKEHLIDK